MSMNKKVDFKDKKIWLGLVAIVVAVIAIWAFAFGGTQKVSVAAAMSGNQDRVWLVLDDEKPTENSKIEKVLVTKNGQATAYSIDTDLEEIKGMTTSKLVESAKEADERIQKLGLFNYKEPEARDLTFTMATEDDGKKLASESVVGARINKYGGTTKVELNRLVPQEESVKLFGKEYAVFSKGEMGSLVTLGLGAKFDDPNSSLLKSED